MAYDSTTGQVTAPVTITDLQKATGHYSHSDVGGIIKNADINIWSKCKPFRSINLCFADDDARDLARYNADCGFTINSYTSVYDLLNAIKSKAVGSLVWTYNKPDGSTYHYRMGDFIGYQTLDTNPTIEYGLTTTSVYYEDLVGVKNTDGIHVESLRLKLSDMKTTNAILTASGKTEPYIGFIWGQATNFSASTCHVYTLDCLAANDLCIPSSSLVAGMSYVCAFFYSSVSINNMTGSSAPSGVFVPIPYPRADFSVNSGFGLNFTTTVSVDPLGKIYTFAATPKISGGNDNGERTLDILSFHQRSESHYSSSDNVLYTITDSADSSGYEADYVCFTSSSIGENVYYISANGYSQTSGASKKEAITPGWIWSFDITASGYKTFVKYRHLTKVGSTWHQVTVVRQLSYRAPSSDSLDEGIEL